jgi:exportin-T
MYCDIVRCLRKTAHPPHKHTIVPMPLQVVTGSAFQQYSDGDKQAIAQKVAAWCFADSALCLSAPPFLKNKVAQLFAHVSSRLYPAGLWPTCFADMLAATAQHAQHIDMFLRIMLALDADVISLEVPRNDEESRRSMALKDALRERDIADITQAWAYIVERYAHEADGSEVAATCLTAAARYADWVDIHLIASDRCARALLGLLQGSSKLQGAAADTIVAIVSKRMDALPKLELIQQLAVVPVLAQWEEVLRGSADADGDGEGDAAAKIANLLNTLALEAIESIKRLENHIISMQARAWKGYV